MKTEHDQRILEGRVLEGQHQPAARHKTRPVTAATAG